MLAQNPGKIYLGGGFDGAPFSVVSVTAAHVGPFDLGTVVIHFPLRHRPRNGGRSRSRAGAADQIPHIIDGIVVHVRNIRAYINRNDFMVNPTSCDPTKLRATVIGNGASSTTTRPTRYADPFQPADCEALQFEPKFQRLHERRRRAKPTARACT